MLIKVIYYIQKIFCFLFRLEDELKFCLLSHHFQLMFVICIINYYVNAWMIDSYRERMIETLSSGGYICSK